MNLQSNSNSMIVECRRGIRSYLPTVLVAMLLILSGCGSSMYSVKAGYTIKERVRLGFRTIVIRELEDSWNTFERMRYTPVYRFELLDEYGHQTHEWVGALHFERLIRSSTDKVVLKSTEQLDSLRCTSVWEFSDTLRSVQAREDVPVMFWSIDSVRNGDVIELTRIPRGDGTHDRFQQRGNAQYMVAMQEEARRYVYFDMKSYILSKVAEL
jgi:hypothetical protein